jgi:hypothetical protein
MSIFTANNKANINKNKFDLSHQRLMTLDWGVLTPAYLQEVLPGDSFRVSTEQLTRLMPTLSPVMGRVDLVMHYFYCPNRILWDKWEDFIRRGDDGVTDESFPLIDVSGETTRVQEKSLWDYMGLPPASTSAGANTYVNALPFRAYAKVYNEWYRDVDLVSEVDINFTTSGVHTAPSLLNKRQIAYEPDYFVTSRPNAQKGDPINFLPSYRASGDSTVFGNQTDGLTASNVLWQDISDTANPQGDYPGYLYASAPANKITLFSSVQDLRRAEAMQQYMESLQRAGNRYREYLAGIWGVISSDSRIDIPEYLGGWKQPIVISEVLSTTETSTTGTSDGTGVGEMYGHGVSAGQHKGFKKSFEEHGFVIGILAIRPKASYSKGVERFWTRTDPFDYALPQFAQIGEEVVYDREIYFDTDAGDLESTNALGTFGYQSRYADYKFGRSRICGDFRTSLRYWHLDRDITGTPLLNQDFIQVEEGYNDLDRIFQVTTGHPFWCQMYHKVDAIRPLPYNANPKLT